MIETMFLAILYLIGVIASYYIAIYRSGLILGMDRLVIHVLLGPWSWFGSESAGIWGWMVGRRG